MADCKEAWTVFIGRVHSESKSDILLIRFPEQRPCGLIEFLYLSSKIRKWAFRTDSELFDASRLVVLNIEADKRRRIILQLTFHTFVSFIYFVEIGFYIVRDFIHLVLEIASDVDILFVFISSTLSGFNE
ncbi:hypothetical protein ABY42_18780 (plasmid) [Haloferax gibbonsii]|uniref:Uncharacterized protein n=1 Tax=Haloferax gibbonsii TaxID=35746 RepID=A0A0K1IZY6_HALGI|nr:hypothetical protein ABY42_18780 [Haloferax gibbonsii]